MLIRPADPDDFDEIRRVELAAFETLRSAGAMSGPPAATSAQELRDYLEQGLLLVACAEDGAIAGYCGGCVADGFLHIGEVDVHPEWQRMGLGGRLLGALIELGRARGLLGATLTTDRFAPFNAPFYKTMGFQLLEDKATPPWLRDILQLEVDRGLDPFRRVGMILVYSDTDLMLSPSL
jgi:predicted N-acetyltransferase YhbS